MLRNSRGRPRNAPAAFIHPCRPIVATRPPRGPGWAHELKQDGYRLQMHILLRKLRVRICPQRVLERSVPGVGLLMSHGSTLLSFSSGMVSPIWMKAARGSASCTWRGSLLGLNGIPLARQSSMNWSAPSSSLRRKSVEIVFSILEIRQVKGCVPHSLLRVFNECGAQVPADSD